MYDGTVTDQRGRDLFGTLALQSADALLALVGAFRGDPRADRVDVGVARLGETRGIYMAASGRINVAGLTPETVPTFVGALASLR